MTIGARLATWLQRSLAAVTRDPLTGLATRPHLVRATRRLVAAQAPGEYLALLYVDLDGFKRLNDTAGHDVGDHVLIDVAARLSEVVGRRGVVARFAGDEFGVLVPGATSTEAVIAFAESVARSVRDDAVRTSASVGVAILEPTARPRRQAATIAEALIMQADLAMLAAKRDGGGRVDLFTPEMAQRARTVSEAVAQRAQVVLEQSFRLDFQPVYDLHSARAQRVEALLRGFTPLGQTLRPRALLRVAEATGRMPEVTHWVLEHALAEAAAWRREGHLVPVSVNLGCSELALTSSVAVLARSLDRAGLPGQALVVELNRDSSAPDLAEVESARSRLREHKIALVLENADTDWSMADLHSLSPDEVTLSQSSLASDGAATTVGSALVDAATYLGARVTAKHLDTDALLRRAVRLGCAGGQGSLLAPECEPGLLEWRTPHLTSRDGTARPLTGRGAVDTFHTCTPTFSYAERAFAETRRSRDPSSPLGPGGFSRPRSHFDAAEES